MVERRRRAAPTPEATEMIPFVDAVREGKRIIEAEEEGWWRIGELADRIQPIYGESTLKRFALAINVAVCTVARRRDVYRNWKNYAPGRELPYAVARELAAHPDRIKIVEENPNITKQEATKLRRDDAGKQTAASTTSEETDTPFHSTQSWQRKLWRLAHKVTAETADWTQIDFETPPDLAPGLTEAVRKAADALVIVANCLEGQSESMRRAPSIFSSTELAVPAAN